MNTTPETNVSDYYGNVLKSNKDLKTSACCDAEDVSSDIRPLLMNIHQDVRDTFYGCGTPVPEYLEGTTILDLGCGSGRDVYLLSQLVGEEGKVIGVDMTDVQIQRAISYEDYHMEKFGYKSSNVKFLSGNIKDLKGIGIADNSVDVVISNCVINLSTDKEQVFSEIFRVLKPGGELYFSDVFADRRIPQELIEDQVLHGECLAGALYEEDFRRMINKIGYLDIREVKRKPIALTDSKIKEKIGEVNFNSITYRVFKLPLEDRAEDYGHKATYVIGNKCCSGSNEKDFVLDKDTTFKPNSAQDICGNTATILKSSRFSKYFAIEGDKSNHRGRFGILCGDSVVKPKTSCC